MYLYYDKTGIILSYKRMLLAKCIENFRCLLDMNVVFSYFYMNVVFSYFYLRNKKNNCLNSDIFCIIKQSPDIYF